MNIIHILPINDLYPHIESLKCLCRPIIKYEKDGNIIIHNAYDGRDRQEQLIDNLNNLINEN